MVATTTLRQGGAGLSRLLADPATAASVHVTKFAHPRWNPTGERWSGMCADAATLMAARLAGSSLDALAPASARSPRDLLLAVRRSAVGAGPRTPVDTAAGIDVAGRGRALDALGLPWRHTDDVDELLGAVRDGRPVIWNGWAAGAGTWHARLGARAVAPDGHHAVAVTRDARSGAFVVNDPNSRIGPIAVTERELRAFSDTPPADFLVGGTVLRP